ncbi:hypothetical protein DsansV1_C03g0036091 [Dioscorea sansibarensis]
MTPPLGSSSFSAQHYNLFLLTQNHLLEFGLTQSLRQYLAMGSAGKASWMVAVSVGAVEALKDQGICRWNYAFRCLHQRTKNNTRSFSQTKRMSCSSSSSSSCLENRKTEEVDQKAKQSEESLRKVVYLSSWGPY